MLESNQPLVGTSAPAPLTTKEAARYLTISPRTLEDWRYRGGGGPPFRLLGRSVRYAVSDLIAFMNGSVWRASGCPLAA